MRKLDCPSCGGALELPDQNGVYHCMYCGSKIKIDQTQTDYDNQKIIQLRELGKTALDLRNFEEVRDYANKILEIDSKDGEAWIMKGVGTFYSAPEKDASFFEALGYLKKASQLDPSSSEVLRWRTDLGAAYGMQKNKLGTNEFHLGKDQFERNAGKIDPAVILEVEDHFSLAMSYYLLAAKYAPGNIGILTNIRSCDLAARQMGVLAKWPEEVAVRINFLNKYESKKSAEKRLPELGKQVKALKDEIKALKQRNDIFSKLKLWQVEAKLESVMVEVKLEETKLHFDFPAANFDW